MPPWLLKISTEGNLIYADFDVCPMSEDKPGWMRFICIEDAKNIVVENHNWETKEIKMYKVRNH